MTISDYAEPKAASARPKRGFAPGLIAIIFLSSFFAIYSEQRPSYNWDMLAYIAVALLDAGVPASKVHDITYGSLASIPASAHKELIDDGGYRTHVARDPQRFMDQLPFYSVKPVYPWLISLLYRAGVNLPHATVIVSATAYWLIPIVLFLWLWDLGCGYLAAPLAATLALASVIPSGSGSSPDSLSVLVVFFALYLGFGRRRYLLASLMLSFSILVRPENVVFAVAYAIYLAYAREIRLKSMFFYVAAVLAIFFALAKWSGNYGWSTLMYYTFMNFDIDVKTFVSPLNAQDYIMIYIRGVDDMIFRRGNNVMNIAPLMIATIGIVYARSSWRDPYFHMLPFAIVCAAIRFFILPQHFDRAFQIQNLMVIIAFAYYCRMLLAPPLTEQQDAPAHNNKVFNTAVTLGPS